MPCSKTGVSDVSEHTAFILKVKDESQEAKRQAAKQALISAPLSEYSVRRFLTEV
jgi:hypothetical protein